MILYPVISSWMVIQGRRRLVEVFPNSVREWWDKWELRGLIFISLVSQIILALLGSRRKYRTNKVIETIVWFTYLLADKVPTIALGVISSKLGDYYNKHGDPLEDLQMIAFWAPFLLMHLGGPDTITAYSLEDNELWLRHLAGLVVQTLFSLYIILLSWKGTSWLAWLSAPMLIIGFVKYGERTWSLYSASINYCRDSHLSSAVTEIEDISDEERIELVFSHYKGFKSNFASLLSDMVYGTKDIKLQKSQLCKINYQEAFVVLDYIHGFWYDVLFTKAAVTHSIWGCISRLLTSLAVLIVFILYIVFSAKHKRSLGFDSVITYMLMVVAVISEIFSIIPSLVYSEWTTTYLMSHRIQFPRWIINWLKEWNQKKASSWSIIGQSNFLTLLCRKEEFEISGHSLSVAKLQKLPDLAPCAVSSELKNMLWNNALEKMKSTPIRASRYRKVVKARGLRRRRHTIENLEFHQSILLWHIVTNVCYHCDENAIHSRRESKVLSDYMFYLLVKKRHMLPIGTGLLSLRDTLFEANKYCQQKKLTLSLDVNESCKALLQCITQDAKHRTVLPIGRSVFRYALLIAYDFLTEQQCEGKKIWEFLIGLWIEILHYSAAHSRVDRHAQEMSIGGEFISHIWLLQASTCLLDQFHVTEPALDDESDGVVS